MVRHTLLIAILALSAMGCRNSCQQLCARMYDYAQECELGVDEDELASCIDDQAGLESEDREVCRSFGSAEVLRNEWSCEELESYWDEATSTGGGDDTDDP